MFGMLVVLEMIASIDCYLFDGKTHRLYRLLVSFITASESALAEFLELLIAEPLALW